MFIHYLKHHSYFIAICEPECYNGGKCVSPGVCVCPVGFEGDLCKSGEYFICLTMSSLCFL